MNDFIETLRAESARLETEIQEKIQEKNHVDEMLKRYSSKPPKVRHAPAEKRTRRPMMKPIFAFFKNADKSKSFTVEQIMKDLGFVEADLTNIKRACALLMGQHKIKMDVFGLYHLAR